VFESRECSALDLNAKQFPFVMIWPYLSLLRWPSSPDKVSLNPMELDLVHPSPVICIISEYSC